MTARLHLADPRELRRFLRFAGVGAVNTAFGYAVFALFILVGPGAGVEALGSTFVGALFNFLTTGVVVFGSREGRLLPRFLLAYGLQCTANILALRAFAAVNVAALPAEAAILPPLAVATFLVMRRFVFTPAPADRLTP